MQHSLHITIGFWVLSFVVLTTIFFLPVGFKPDMYQHAALAMLAWFVFAVLLLGHKYLGWRGRTAIRWTLGGLCLLLFSYFGCRILLTFMV